MTASEPHTDLDADVDADREPAVLGEYTWEAFLREYGYDDDVDAIDRPDGGVGDSEADGGLVGRFTGSNGSGDRAGGPTVDWAALDVDPVTYLGFHPEETDAHLDSASDRAGTLWRGFQARVAATPVVKDVYGWEQFKWEYHYEDDGSLPRDGGHIEPFDPVEYLGFDPADTESVLGEAGSAAAELAELVDDRTVDVNPDIDEDAFFSDADGHTTLVNRYDLEKTVSMEKKRHLEEVERYWVDKPNAFVIIFHSRTENEKKYYLVDPYFNDLEDDVRQYLAGKLRTNIRYSHDNVVLTNDIEERREVLEREAYRLLSRYDIYDEPTDSEGVADRVGSLLPGDGLFADDATSDGGLDGITARPEPVVLEENPDSLSEYQAEKLLYRLRRDFLGYERIDGIKHDIQVEDISCDGYDSPVFVYHTEYEQLITNVHHGRTQLDNFVVKLAQRSGKGISKRRPQVDATLPDGSRAQLTLGNEVSDHGTNYTIRQFNDVPFTPVDLINWNTFSLDEMAFLWLCIESEKSVMFGGGTASGKTTSLNAVSLFIPSNSKIVSIEDTREVELPQRNWVASVTRPSFTDDDKGDIDEFDLLEAALRQRPEYIVMGEVRGEEGRTLFQVMSTGHTTLTTFHADSVDEVLKRFTTDPINVSKTMFTALDLVSIQTQTRVEGRKVRRNRVLTDVNYFDTENDEINVQDVYQWQPEADEFLHLSESNNLDDIMFDRGWSRDRLEEELFMRRTVLAYLIEHDLNTYAEVAATIQAFINDPDTILTLMARDRLEESLQDLRGMESVLIDVNPEKEALVPRPEPTPAKKELAASVLEEAEERLFEDYADREPSALVSALPDVEEVRSVVAGSDVDPLAADGDVGDIDDVAVDDAAGDMDEADTAGDTDVGDTDDAVSDPFDAAEFSLNLDESDHDDDFDHDSDVELDRKDDSDDGGDFDFDTEE